MAFDPEKVERKDVADFDDVRGLFVRASDFDALLDINRHLEVEIANLKFLRASDDAIETEQAHTIQRLESGNKLLSPEEARAAWNRYETK